MRLGRGLISERVNDSFGFVLWNIKLAGDVHRVETAAPQLQRAFLDGVADDGLAMLH
jgi:hypothetical protein